MAFADTSMSYLAYGKEVTWNTIPAIAFTKVRHTSESFKTNKVTQQSEEIRDDFMVPDIVDVGFSGGGDFNFEWSYGVFDSLLVEGALRSTLSTAQVESQSDISVASGIYSSAALADFTVFAVGDWVRVSGFTNAVNNGMKRVTARTTLTMTVAGATLTDESATTGTFEHDGNAYNGTTATSWTFEKGFTDINQFWALSGCRIGSFTFNAAAQQRITGACSVIGATESTDTSTHSTGAVTEAATNGVWDASNDLTLLQLDETDPVVGLKEFSWTLNGNLREQPAAMSANLVGVGMGQFNIELGMRVYFENYDEYARYISGQATALAVGVTDNAGNDMVFYFPKTRLTDSQILQTGANADVDVEMTFMAYRDPTLDAMMQVAVVDA